MEPWFSLEGTGGRNFRHFGAGICPPEDSRIQPENDGLEDVFPFLEDAGPPISNMRLLTVCLIFWLVLILSYFSLLLPVQV